MRCCCYKTSLLENFCCSSSSTAKLQKCDKSRTIELQQTVLTRKFSGSSSAIAKLRKCSDLVGDMEMRVMECSCCKGHLQISRKTSENACELESTREKRSAKSED